jgi:REP element-mobilizing transposase RayT
VAINYTYHPQFFTATIFEWKHLLKEDEFKDIMIRSLQFLRNEGSIVIYSYVIMPNHIHLIWQIQDGFKKDVVQMRFLKFTSQQMKFKLIDSKNDFLNEFLVDLADRKYQFWKRNSLSVDLWSDDIFMQKLDYIHNNPVQEKWKLAEHPEDYKYSSARFYTDGYDEFNLVTHYNGS